MESRQMVILLDTSVLIDAQRDQKTFQELEKLQDNIRISRITACELIYGSRNQKEKKQNLSIIRFFPLIEIDEKISERAFTIIHKYGLKARFGVADALIAATAVENNLPLWTLNRKHFRMIEELRLFE